MSEEKEDFRSDRFTWKAGELQKEDEFPDETGTVFSTYYEMKEFYAKKKKERKSES